jgi:hypothetical protein
MSINKAYCGYDCTTCLGWIAWSIQDPAEKEDYLNKNPGVIPCTGCHAAENICEKTCSSCAIRLCGIQKEVEACELCADYPCKLHNKGGN